MAKANIICLDIETFPARGYTWGPKWESNILEFDKRISLASFAYKKLENKSVIVWARPDFTLYERDKEDDIELVKALWNVFDAADVIIAHNGRAFDFKQSNAFFVEHGLPPPSDYVILDTKLVAKRHFKFLSNSLADLGAFLQVGAKARTGGMDLWWDCMEGKPEAWKRMRAYNKQDVVLLEKVYLKLRPWMKNHPNMNVLTGNVMCCTVCGSSHVIMRGWQHTRTGKKRKFQCTEEGCGAWSTGPHVPVGVVLR